MPYAQNTDVSVPRSQAEIEATLDRYGATAFAYARESTRVMIAFRLESRHYRVILLLPASTDYKDHQAANGRWVSGQKDYEKVVRRRWRSLALWIKAVMVAVEDGIVTAQQALQAFVMLPDGRTAGEWLEPQIRAAYETGQMPRLLPGLGESSVAQD